MLTIVDQEEAVHTTFQEVVIILNLQYLFLRPLSRTTHSLFVSFTYKQMFFLVLKFCASFI